jgi:hypothetical protein
MDQLHIVEAKHFVDDEGPNKRYDAEVNQYIHLVVVKVNDSP